MATIASLLRERVSLQVNCVDRIFLAGYIPKLQSEGMVVRFLLDRGFPIPSPAALGKIGEAYVRAVERFAARYRIPVVHFKKGESKEQVARRYMRKAERNGRFGVVMIGVAQEKTSAWPSCGSRAPVEGAENGSGRVGVQPESCSLAISGRRAQAAVRLGTSCLLRAQASRAAASRAKARGRPPTSGQRAGAYLERAVAHPASIKPAGRRVARHVAHTKLLLLDDQT